MKWMILFALLIPSLCSALEKDYSDTFCKSVGGTREVVIKGGRVDCLTATHSVEVEFAHKWAESVGQSLYYGLITGKKPGVAIIAGPDDQRFVDRLRLVASEYGIDVWRLDP